MSTKNYSRLRCVCVALAVLTFLISTTISLRDKYPKKNISLFSTSVIQIFPKLQFFPQKYRSLLNLPLLFVTNSWSLFINNIQNSGPKLVQIQVSVNCIFLLFNCLHCICLQIKVSICLRAALDKVYFFLCLCCQNTMPRFEDYSLFI